MSPRSTLVGPRGTLLLPCLHRVPPGPTSDQRLKDNERVKGGNGIWIWVPSLGPTRDPVLFLWAHNHRGYRSGAYDRRLGSDGRGVFRGLHRDLVWRPRHRQQW